MRKPKHITFSTDRRSLPISQCFAKTYFFGEKKQGGRDVLNHCHIVGEVAREIIARMPCFLKKSLFPVGSELIAAAHDWGKISPTFQEKIYRGCDGYIPNSLDELNGINPAIEKNWGGHAGVSMATAQFAKVGQYIPEILGQHHGFTPNLAATLACDECYGGPSWLARRLEYIEALKKLLNCDFPEVKSAQHASVLSGLTTVSDWIGSGSFFEDPTQDWQHLIPKALDSAGFITPKLRVGLSFQDIFGFSPRPVQQDLIQCCDASGVYIMEAPMGVGKTEAALYAAYRIMSKGEATGIYFALPTQLTSNKIHDRVTQFLGKILTDEWQHRKALLLHGNAWLVNTEIGVEGNPDGSWFQSSKRGILAPFAVGTVDQALMAVMNVKHGFIRAFGLAGKVVILDEVHSYDVYTGTLIDALVNSLRQLHCTVIILSATLSIDRRAELLGAIPKKQNYPLVSSHPFGSPMREVKGETMVDKKVSLVWGGQNDAILKVLECASKGQQVLWVENTVAEAQEIYSILAARTDGLNVICGLLHSRFIKVDRERKEQKWVGFFGKSGMQERSQQGRILVGTQVLEQSLDIDADFLVTRFCPTDMLLQRLGRLWRHDMNLRPIGAEREGWIIAPKLECAIQNTEKYFKATTWVYSPYVLCRSLEVWHQKKFIFIPSDIRQLIEATYCERDEHDNWGALKHELIEGNPSKRRVGTKAMKALATIGLSKAGTTLPENKATTRYSEQDSVQVLVLRKIQKEDHGAIKLTFLNGDDVTLPVNIKAKSKHVWRMIAVKIMQHIVNVAEYRAPPAVSPQTINWLRDYLYLGDRHDEESLVRVVLVGANDEFMLPNGGVLSSKYALGYREDIGYSAKKNR